MMGCMLSGARRVSPVIVGCSIAIMPHLTKEKQAPQEK
jgi:hypothetical protein